MIDLRHGDCLEVMPTLDAESIDACVCDPPYGIAFMGRKWDSPDNIAFRPEMWAEVWRVLKPGAHLVAFGGDRTYHRMACAIEDAGLQIRHTIMYCYGSGFPKSHNLDGIWKGWGTSLKPAHEPIVWAQKPLKVIPDRGILSHTTALIEALLWSIAPARFVALCSALSQSGSVQDLSGSARWIVAAELGARSVEASELTGMFSSPETASTFLSIVWLWNGILAGSSDGQNTFTIETESSLTTGLITLNYLISAITPESTILDAIAKNGLWLSAETADAHSSGTQDGLLATQRHFVQDGAFWNTANAIACALASIAEASLSHLRVISDCSVEPLVIRRIERPIVGTTRLHTGLSPNLSPICVARKPLSERTIAANVLRHGCGGLNIDACRVDASGDKQLAEKYASVQNSGSRSNRIYGGDSSSRAGSEPHVAGRWPANVAHDGSDEVLAGFAKYGESKSSGGINAGGFSGKVYGKYNQKVRANAGGLGDTGTPARFFFSAKADADDRLRSKHPTVKPVNLMRWLVRMVTPIGGTVLDPFAGSGTTGMACMAEGFNAVLIEREEEYVADIRRRIAHVKGGDTPLFAAVNDHDNDAPLFAAVDAQA